MTKIYYRTCFLDFSLNNISENLMIVRGQFGGSLNKKVITTDNHPIRHYYQTPLISIELLRSYILHDHTSAYLLKEPANPSPQSDWKNERFHTRTGS
jgi:hypothetical protein